MHGQFRRPGIGLGEVQRLTEVSRSENRDSLATPIDTARLSGALVALQDALCARQAEHFAIGRLIQINARPDRRPYEWGGRIAQADAKDIAMAESHARKIAVVDDDHAARDSLQFLLEVMGYVVETFASADAFLKANIQQVDRLILDHHMPEMTGLQLAERLRADGSGVPILLITGSPSPEIVARASGLGIRVHEKPPGEEDILDFISGIRP